jgi:LPXTG-motif cell wall-anchored protein
VIISHVECYPGDKPGTQSGPSMPEDQQPRPTTPELPDTGANGSTLGLGAVGLLLMTAGSGALYITRRRGRRAG